MKPHSRREPHPHGPPETHYTGVCPGSGKRQYSSRKIGRRAARALYPHAALRPYRCDTCGYWHIGNTPERVKRGFVR